MRRRQRFSKLWRTTRNQSSAFWSSLSTSLRVRKGRGSQKEETRCISRSLIMLLPKLAEKSKAWLATNIKWIKRKEVKIKALVLTSVETASRPWLKYFWNSTAKIGFDRFKVASKP